MELTTLRYFVTVAKELHFRKAAAKLNITQAPLSAAVRKLEEELGCQLFNRTSRVVELTEAGALFLREAEAVLNRAELAQKHLEDFLCGKNEQISIGYNEPAIHSVLPGILSKIRAGKSALRLQLKELETAEQCQLLKNGSLDIGFLRPGVNDLAGLKTRLIFRDNYVLAIPAAHKLAEKEKISIEDLAGKDVILFAREVNPAIYDRLVLALSADGLTAPKFRQDARNKSSMLAMVQAGFGIALIPESCCGGASEQVVIRKLSSPLPSVDIMAAWDENNESPALQKFLSFLPDPV